jgi:hypothetical protein
MYRPSAIDSDRSARILRTITALALVLVSVLLTGCARGAQMKRTTGDMDRGIVLQSRSGAEPEELQSQRQLIRRGAMGLAVVELEPARARLERSAIALNAEVSRAEVTEDARAEYALRVPPERLEALMDSVAILGDVDSRTVSAEDVTEHVVDAEARLAALRASRDRLTQLLERATSVQDVISVERELARVQGEIESLDGRLQAMKGQVAMSELTVRMWRRPVLGPLGLLLSGAATLVEKLFVWR